jgi:hypothetical protein
LLREDATGYKAITFPFDVSNWEHFFVTYGTRKLVKRLVHLPTLSRLFPCIGTKEGARQTTRNRTFQVKIDENQQSEESDALAA